MGRFYLGVDGGGTNTRALVGDAGGNILGVGRGGGSNYQTAGLEAAGDHVTQAVERALAAAGAAVGDLEAAAFAMAGADFPEDYTALESMITARWPGLAHELVNDTWAAWRGGSESGWGLVAVAGTGSNTAGRAPSGETRTGFGLTYEFGARGGAQGRA